MTSLQNWTGCCGVHNEEWHQHNLLIEMQMRKDQYPERTHKSILKHFKISVSKTCLLYHIQMCHAKLDLYWDTVLNNDVSEWLYVWWEMIPYNLHCLTNWFFCLFSHIFPSSSSSGCFTGHGTCSCGRCVCEKGWFGKLCQHPRKCNMTEEQSKSLCESADGTLCSGKGEYHCWSRIPAETHGPSEQQVATPPSRMNFAWEKPFSQAISNRRCGK